MTPADLPQPGDSRLDAEELGLVDTVLGQLDVPEHPWTHETHVAPQHIEELRQLVEADPPQEAADRGDSRIVPVEKLS